MNIANQFGDLACFVFVFVSVFAQCRDDTRQEWVQIKMWRWRFIRQSSEANCISTLHSLHILHKDNTFYKKALHTFWHTAFKSVHTTFKSVHTTFKSEHTTFKSVHTTFKSEHTTLKLSVHATSKSVHTVFKSVHTVVKSVLTSFKSEHPTNCTVEPDVHMSSLEGCRTADPRDTFAFPLQCFYQCTFCHCVYLHCTAVLSAIAPVHCSIALHHCPLHRCTFCHCAVPLQLCSISLERFIWPLHCFYQCTLCPCIFVHCNCYRCTSI